MGKAKMACLQDEICKYRIHIIDLSEFHLYSYIEFV
jgi:hypothetical protein